MSYRRHLRAVRDHQEGKQWRAIEPTALDQQFLEWVGRKVAQIFHPERCEAPFSADPDSYQDLICERRKHSKKKPHARLAKAGVHPRREWW